jgi:peptidoglycan/LPS O-acetylase OafA/YrhL
LSHTWSLSLEEQFYLLWPSLFVFLSRKKAIYVSSILAFSGPVLRVASYYLFPSLRSHEPGMLHTRIDTLMMGCVAAFLLNSPSWRERLKRVSADRWLIPPAILILVIEPFVMLHFTGRTLSVISLGMATIEAFAIGSIILLLVGGKVGVAHRAFNRPAAIHVGRLSYSLYIWQQLFLCPCPASNAFSYVWRFSGAYIVSLCSFNYFEKPFLRLRKKFRRVPVE